MSTYRIIGADQRVYGPVTSDQMRQWIAEGRANDRTRVQAEGTVDWKPLAAIPEFADALRAAAGAFPGHGARDIALEAVKGPAIALKVIAILYAVFAVVEAVMHVTGFTFRHLSPEQMKTMELLGGDKFGLVDPVIHIVIAAIVWRGASLMQALQSHTYAITVSILVMLPCITPCCFIGMPFGIWSLVVLNKPQVKPEFT